MYLCGCVEEREGDHRHTVLMCVCKYTAYSVHTSYGAYLGLIAVQVGKQEAADDVDLIPDKP